MMSNHEDLIAKANGALYMLKNFGVEDEVDGALLADTVRELRDVLESVTAPTEPDPFSQSPHMTSKYWAELVKARNRIVEVEEELAEMSALAQVNAMNVSDYLDAVEDAKQARADLAAVQQPNSEAVTAPTESAEAATCDGGCNNNDGPQEDCSLHGRPVAQVWEMVSRLSEELRRAKESAVPTESADIYATRCLPCYGTGRTRIVNPERCPACKGTGFRLPVPVKPNTFNEQVRAERVRQVERGFDQAHDDKHGVDHLLRWAQEYSRRGERVKSDALVEAARECFMRNHSAVPVEPENEGEKR